MFESTKIIGQRQFEKAQRLFESAKVKVKGSVSFIHQYVNMTGVVLQTNKGTVSTCKPAMGYSFAAGTTDGMMIGMKMIFYIHLFCIKHF